MSALCHSTPPPSSAPGAPLEQATQLPGAAFLDPAVLAWELEHLFAREWICAGHVDQIREPGQFFTVEVAGESVVVVGDDDGLPRAFVNTCRHRGARVVDEPEGRDEAAALPVPRVDLRARRLAAQRALHRRPRGLRPVRLRAAPGPARGRRGPRPARPVRRGPAARAATSATSPSSSPATAPPTCAAAPATPTRSTPTGRCIAENYNECLHCPGVHPELNALSHYLSGRADRGRRRVVRRLDDADRGRRDDGPRRPPEHRRDARDPLLRAVPERAHLAASRLRDAAHAVAARGRPHGRRLRVVLRGRRHGRSTTPSPSGTRSTARTGTSASSPSAACEPRLHARPLHDAGGRRAPLRRDGRRPLRGGPDE